MAGRRRLPPLLLALLLACKPYSPCDEEAACVSPSTSSGEATVSGESSSGESSSGDGSSSSGSTAVDSGSDAGTNGQTDSTDSTGTTSTGAPAVCGDGDVDPGEECDDGNTDDADACPPTCLRDRWVFVTAATHKPDFGGAEGADSLCRQYALQSGRADDTWKSFKAWVSDSTTDIRDRLTPGVLARYVRTDGVVVARGVDQFFSGTLEASISVDEFGAPQEGGVITGTRPDGTAVPGSLHCDDWTFVGDQLSLHYGVITATDEAWTMPSDMDFNPTACGASWRLYCIEGA
ncbi:hypothetical protein [Nannocystis pusilla]|uniref:hypothetical protein n=1 Tax=Nannocystis pusilla TaxID=889268 RepID=UPI001CC98DB1|nr:hypothetical protein [Nannocystis pusilla]